MKIGFSLNKSDGGPSGFLRKLKQSIQRQRLANTGYCFDPFTTCNLFANKAYSFWWKPYIFRVDGIIFDSALTPELRKIKNEDNVKGILKSKGVIFQSKFSKRIVKSILGLEPSQSTVIVNGTDLTRFNPNGDNLRSKLGISEEAFVFITSAKWRKHKRLTDVIEVYKRFKKSSPNETYLIIIGETDISDADQHILFMQHIPNCEFPNYLRTANCYLFLSWLDPCPNSVVEAIACGLPVICSNQGGTREIVELTNGGIVAEADAEFDYNCIDLYNPPSVNYSIVLNAVDHLISNYEVIKSQIDTRPIDIDFVASEYMKFIKSAVR